MYQQLLLTAILAASAIGQPVRMVITAEAKRGKDIPELQQQDVMAHEKKERLLVTGLVPLQGQNEKLELFLLLDDASSAILGSQLGDLSHFIDGLPATTAIGIGYMRNGGVSVAKNFTADHSDATRALRLPVSSVMSSPFLSLSDLIKRWPGTSARREVIIVTSGDDLLGGMGTVNPFLDNAIEDAQKNGVVVFAIYMPGAGQTTHNFFRVNWAQGHLAKLAEETGGEAYMLGFGPPVSFAPYLEDVARHLEHQYLVTVVFKPGAKAGFREVKLSTEVPNAELIAPRQVWVPR